MLSRSDRGCGNVAAAVPGSVARFRVFAHAEDGLWSGQSADRLISIINLITPPALDPFSGAGSFSFRY